MNRTVFGDVRQRAQIVYRVTTQSSEYIIGVHESGGRRFAVVADRKAVIARDSDPRVGTHSLFELPLEQWPGKLLEIATMTTSPIVSAVVEHNPGFVLMVSGATTPEEGGRSPWARPDPEEAARTQVDGVQVIPPGGLVKKFVPPGMPENPRIVGGFGKGTHPAMHAPSSPAGQVAQQVVIGQAAAPANPAEPQLPYPQRHVGYAESIAALLRSMAKRDRLFEDVAHDPALKARLRRALDDSALLLETIRRRDRK